MYQQVYQQVFQHPLSVARKVVVLFVQGARKESGADCQWCCLSGPLQRPQHQLVIRLLFKWKQKVVVTVLHEVVEAPVIILTRFTAIFHRPLHPWRRDVY